MRISIATGYYPIDLVNIFRKQICRSVVYNSTVLGLESITLTLLDAIPLLPKKCRYERYKELAVCLMK